MYNESKDVLHLPFLAEKLLKSTLMVKKIGKPSSMEGGEISTVTTTCNEKEKKGESRQRNKKSPQ
jgi:hypothetical protein